MLRQHFSDAKLHELSERIDPETSSGLAYYPLPRPGERFPICDATLEPRLSPRPDDPALFLKALFEGIATIEAKGYAKLAELGAPVPKTILSSGGGASNPVWQRIRERTTGVSTVGDDPKEGSGEPPVPVFRCRSGRQHCFHPLIGVR